MYWEGVYNDVFGPVFPSSQDPRHFVSFLNLMVRIPRIQIKCDDGFSDEPFAGEDSIHSGVMWRSNINTVECNNDLFCTDTRQTFDKEVRYFKFGKELEHETLRKSYMT